MFNALDYCRKHAANKTTVKFEDGTSAAIDGVPDAYTAEDLAILAEKNGVKVKHPAKDIISDTMVVPCRTTSSLKAGTVSSDFILRAVGAEVTPTSGK